MEDHSERIEIEHIQGISLEGGIRSECNVELNEDNIVYLNMEVWYGEE